MAISCCYLIGDSKQIYYNGKLNAVAKICNLILNFLLPFLTVRSALCSIKSTRRFVTFKATVLRNPKWGLFWEQAWGISLLKNLKIPSLSITTPSPTFLFPRWSFTRENLYT